MGLRSVLSSTQDESWKGFWIIWRGFHSTKKMAPVEEAHTEIVGSSYFFFSSTSFPPPHFFCGSEDGAQGLAHPRQVLYHWATPGLNGLLSADTSHSYTVLSQGFYKATRATKHRTHDYNQDFQDCEDHFWSYDKHTLIFSKWRPNTNRVTPSFKLHLTSAWCGEGVSSLSITVTKHSA